MAEQWFTNHVSMVRVPSVEIRQSCQYKQSEVIVMFDARRLQRILKRVQKMPEDKQIKVCLWLEGFIAGQRVG